jgi:hypothetical protein
MIEIKNIELAIKAYRSVYGQWPNQSQGAIDTCYYENNAAVIGALTTNNPRSMVFLQLQQSSLSTNPGTAGSFLDPWRHPYVIAMDENGDNQVVFSIMNFPVTNLNGRVDYGSMQSFSIDSSVAVASWGAVAIINKEDMDLCSWQTGMKTK